MPVCADVLICTGVRVMLIVDACTGHQGQHTMGITLGFGVHRSWEPLTIHRADQASNQGELRPASLATAWMCPRTLMWHSVHLC